MTIPNDNEGRSNIQVSMTPIEALLALESYSIGAASMLAYENRGRRQMDQIRVMRDRLIAQIGLPTRVAELLADGESGIFRLADRLQSDDVEQVSFRYDAEKEAILCTVDGRERPFMRLELTPEEDASITGETHWDRRQGRREALRGAYSSVIPSIVAFSQDLASVRVGFSFETEFTVTIVRSLVDERSDAAVRSLVEATLDVAFGTMGSSTSLTGVDHDLWSDRPVVTATISAVIPAVAQDEASSIFEATLRGSASTPAPRP